MISREYLTKIHERMDAGEELDSVIDDVYSAGLQAGYNRGLYDGEVSACSEGALRGAYEQGKADGGSEAIDKIKSKVEGLKHGDNAWLEYDEAIDDVVKMIDGLGGQKE